MKRAAERSPERELWEFGSAQRHTARGALSATLHSLVRAAFAILATSEIDFGRFDSYDL